MTILLFSVKINCVDSKNSMPINPTFLRPNMKDWSIKTVPNMYKNKKTQDSMLLSESWS